MIQPMVYPNQRTVAAAEHLLDPPHRELTALSSSTPSNISVLQQEAFLHEIEIVALHRAKLPNVNDLASLTHALLNDLP